MTVLKRLKWLSAALAVAGVITSATVWGDPSRGRPAIPAARATKLFSDNVVGKYTNQPAIAYHGQDGSVYFALQVKPELTAAPQKPRDIAILVDASASQAGPSLEAARKIAREVIGSASESDRLSIWTVSTPKTTRNLVRGGGMKPASEVKAALSPLEAEYASGAVDLKDTIDRVTKEFDGKATRQQVILYLGDGESALNPLSEKVRYQMADDLRSQNISFYAVPLGSGLNGHNIHTLVSGTGGALIRPSEEKTSDLPAAFKSMASRFHKAMGVPVLDGATAKFGFPASEVYPAKLPPLRADVPTLVVGRLEKGSDIPVRLEVSLSGQVAGAPATAQVSHPLPAPTPENFFLTSMVTQWRASGRSDAPAMLQADRTLALAYETTRLAREEFIEQADWALGSKKIGAAKALYDAANNLDPSDPRIKAGIKLVDKIDKGEVSLDDLKKATQETKVDLEVKENLLAQAPKEVPAPGGAAPAPAADPNHLLQQEAARQKIREQQTTGAVDETLSRARALLNSGDPKSSKDLLVAQRDSIRVLGDIGEATRQRLLNRIDLLLSEVGVRGDAMIRARAEENERIARAHQRQVLADQAVAREDKIRERIRNFTTLMNQARYEDAYREALVMENEFVNEGRRIPIETQAVAKMGQAAANYRDFRELVRLREDRYLLAMMEVEKAHMPYPDEPAVHFPPAKVWREMTSLRRRYASTDFDRDLTPRQKQRFQFLQDSLLHQLNLGALNVAGADYKFGDLLKALQQRMTDDLKRDVTLYIKRESFTKDQADRLKDMPVNLGSLMDATDTVLKEISFKTILDTICRQVGASFWVTPDAIEIVSIETAKTSRVFKVLPVEDLIVPIPNAVNTLALQQQLQVLGQQFSLAGGNAFGALGAFGGGFGGFQFGGGGVQIQGGAGGGGLNGMVGQLFQGGGGGAGGGGQGVLGFGGQQVGQFGNLGGQFGFQGGRQSSDPATELVVLIQSVVDPGFWDPDVSFLSKRILTGQNDQDAPIEAAPVEANERNKMMFNLTTRSLVLFARSRFHRSTPGKPLKRDEMMAAPGANPDGRQLANNNPKPRPAPVPVAVKQPQQPVKVPGDPEKMWKTAIAKGVKDPGMIIACADFLAQAREFKHAAELLKASLRQGLTPERWYQEALAIALEESQASPEEIERAHVSAIDLEPKNAQTYLTVSTSLNQMGDADAAIRLCKIAAKLEPNVPDAYVNALAFANSPKANASYDTSVFAAGGLLNRDWASDSINFHAQARTHLLDTVKKLDLQNKQAEAERVRALIEADRKRDLVVELLWAGSSDLDLRISEPTGTRCSSTQPMTTGGGSLQADQMSLQKDDSRSEIYTASQAFDGTYKISVDRVWGRPQGNKAAIKVVHHQGMPNEKVELFTLDLTKETELTIRFEGGRRKDLAALPSPVDLAKYRARPNESAQVMNKLRALVTGIGNVGLSGGVGASTAPTAHASAATTEKRLGDVTWATRLGSERSVGVDIQSTTTIRPDGQVEVKAAPVFDAMPKDIRVKLDLIPGSE